MDFETMHAAKASGCTVTKTLRCTNGFLAPELCVQGDVTNVSCHFVVFQFLLFSFDVAVSSIPLLFDEVYVESLVLVGYSY